MNENDNKELHIQNNPDIETLDTPVQQTFNQPPTENLNTDMNSLNNLSSGPTTSVSTQLKKNAKKTPFLIIAAVLVFCLLAGGTGVVIKTQIFDKAPNEIDKPASKNDKDDKDDKEDKKDEEEKKDEDDDDQEEVGGFPDDNLVYIQIGDVEYPVNPDEAANTGKTPTNYETIEDAITNEDGYVDVPQKELHEFDTYNGPATFRFTNSGPVYLLESEGSTTIISSLANENDLNSKTELLRRKYDPIVYTNNDGSTEILHAEPIAFKTNNYIMLKIVRDIETGFYIILDNQMKVLFEGPYYEQSIPKATDEAFYIGSMNCKGKLSNNKIGPVFEIFKFDTTTGTMNYLYNIDYTGEENLCM